VPIHDHTPPHLERLRKAIEEVYGP
jgi:hypothetical protein